ncbi:polysaccharide deacetylase [Colletotrichum sublineola]|nr:polysaccharide deacetylase [Colletotrichum sublineola]
MHWPAVFWATLAGLEAAQAHGDGPHVKMVMPRRRSVEELRQMRDSYEKWNPPTVDNRPRDDNAQILGARQASTAASAADNAITLGDNVNCGTAYNNTKCAKGYCCSASGWCGTTSDYCRSPDCQISYGPGCDGNQKPTGRDTSNDARPLLGDIPYGGVGIFNCVNDGDIAITYDDGPYIYTAPMLDAFKAHGAVATWFITGNNIGKGMINVNYSSVIQRMVADGHQIASHTWSHENLDSLTTAQRKNQMVYNEIAFTDILGFYPTYMRPPYSICGSDCQNQMVKLGYHITYFDLDTQGYLNTDPSQIGKSLAIWDAAMLAKSPCNSSYLHIEHDIHEQIATTLTNHMLDGVVANGWNAVTVGTCLGDPPENWYRGNVPSYNFKITPVSAPVCSQTATATSSAVTASGSAAVAASRLLSPISVDATCGPNAGNATCAGSTFGNCCSQNGWCGSTSDYCGTGCQAGYGNCTVSSATVSSAAAAVAASGTSAAVPVILTSLNGNCGPNYGNTSCTGSAFGNCCSQNGWCGSTSDYCGTGCQAGYGNCTVSSASSVSGSPISLNGNCGPNYGNTTCAGSVFGNCCSKNS